MLIAEELLLLSFDDETGRRTLSTEKLDPSLAGALLAELALMERIGVTPNSASLTKRRRVSVTSTKPTDDVELDDALTALVAQEGRPIKDFVSGTSRWRLSKGLRDRMLQRLLKVIPRTAWTTKDPGPEQEIRARLQTALVDGLPTTERTVALISLLLATGHLLKVVETNDKPLVRRRAKELSDGDWAARAVRLAIEELAVAAAVV